MNQIAEEWLAKRMKEIESLQVYHFAESVNRIAQKYNLNPAKCIKLNSNENWFLPKDFISSIALQLSQEIDYRLYPQEELFNLKTSVAKYLNTSSDFVMIGSGGDQLIDMIAKIFLIGGSHAVSIHPTFSFYRISCELVGAKCFQVPLNEDFSLAIDNILQTSSNARVCFLASPNNPTSNQFNADSIKSLIESFPGVVVVDEAYVDYGRYSIARWVEKYENLIVLRTFSKAFGLASLRIGYMIGNSLIIKPFSNKIQYPFPVSTFSLMMANELLKRNHVVQESVRRLKEERVWLIEELERIGLQNIFPSDSNFILIQIGQDLELVHTSLLQKGVFFRSIGNILNYDGCLRCTVGTHEMNKVLIEVLRSIYNSR